VGKAQDGKNSRIKAEDGVERQQREDRKEELKTLVGNAAAVGRAQARGTFTAFLLLPFWI
jgi:hypothetical protein